MALHGGGRLRRRAGRPRRLAGTRPRQGAEGPRHQLRQPHQDDDLARHLLHHCARHRVGPQGRQRRPRGRPRPRLLRHPVDVRAGHRPGGRQPDPPGTGLDIHTTYKAAAGPEGEGGLVGFVTSIIPTTLVSPLVGESAPSTLFVALLIGFAVQALGSTGEAALRGVAVFQKIVFKVLARSLLGRPDGAFGAMAGVRPRRDRPALAARTSPMPMVAFTSRAVFVFGVLGTLLRSSPVHVSTFLRYLAAVPLIVSTSSSETPQPRLIAKMEHLGAPPLRRRHRGADRLLLQPRRHRDLPSPWPRCSSPRRTGTPLSLGEQISLLVFMIIASKGGGRRHRRGPGHACCSLGSPHDLFYALSSASTGSCPPRAP